MANIPLESLKFPNLPDTYTIPVIDNTLTVSGAAADAKATGDAIDLGSVTAELKAALLQLAQKVAYIDDQGQTYYDDLYDALYNRYWQVTNTLSHCTSSNGAEQTIKGNPYTATITASAGYVMEGATVSITMGGADITSTAYSNGVISIAAVTGALVITVTAAQAAVSSIDATFTQGENIVYTNDDLNTLKSLLVVTATLEDSTEVTVSSDDYTLSGTLEVGNSTVTVSFSGKTDTFSVYCYGISFTACKVNGVINTSDLVWKSNTARCSGNSPVGTTNQLQLEGGGDAGVYMIPIRSGATTLTVTKPSGMAHAVQIAHYNNGWVRDVGGDWVKTGTTSDLSSYNNGTYYLAINIAHYTSSSGQTVDGSYNFTGYDMTKFGAAIT